MTASSMYPTISRFTGTYAFLSNFSASPIAYQNVVYPTVEHAFQAAKTLDMGWRRKIYEARTPGIAKMLGRKAPLREGWEGMRVEVMHALLREKFRDPTLADLLLQTHPCPLEEGNSWGDRHWGTVNGEGQNMLGKLLVAVRDSLRPPCESQPLRTMRCDAPHCTRDHRCCGWCGGFWWDGTHSRCWDGGR